MLTDKWILDDDGNPQPCTDLMTWAQWMEHSGKRRILARTPIPTHSGKIVEVSTVFLGLDHRFGDDGPPVLWETLVFVDGDGGEGDRYCTREEAAAGHARWVETMIEREKLA
jgi:hypothetical protein